MLTVYDRNRLEGLSDLLAQLVRRPTHSPFVPETVIVKSLGIARWPSFRLADHLGVCAPVHFPFPATSIGELSQRVLVCVPETSLCRISMNDDGFPRARHSLSFDRMAQDVRRGDRSRRDDDLYLSRKALLSARRCRYISYVGRHIRDNSIILASVLVSELLDSIARGFYPAINRREMPGCVCHRSPAAAVQPERVHAGHKALQLCCKAPRGRSYGRSRFARAWGVVNPSPSRRQTVLQGGAAHGRFCHTVSRSCRSMGARRVQAYVLEQKFSGGASHEGRVLPSVCAAADAAAVSDTRPGGRPGAGHAGGE
jgi:hypothetical protein